MSWEQIIAASQPERGSKLTTYNLTGHLFHLLLNVSWIRPINNNKQQSMPIWNLYRQYQSLLYLVCYSDSRYWIFPRNPCAISPWAVFTKNDQANSPRMTVGILNPLPVLFCMASVLRLDYTVFKGWKKIKRRECFMTHEKYVKFRFLCPWIKSYGSPARVIYFHIVYGSFLLISAELDMTETKGPLQILNIY